MKTHGGNKALGFLIGSSGKLKEGEGGNWWMECKLVEKCCVKIGDHVVVIGEVMHAELYEGGEGRLGTIYADGKYRKLGRILEI